MNQSEVQLSLEVGKSQSHLEIEITFDTVLIILIEIPKLISIIQIMSALSHHQTRKILIM